MIDETVDDCVDDGAPMNVFERLRAVFSWRNHLKYGPKVCAQVGDYSWTYRVDGEGTAEISCPPSPVPVGELEIPAELDGHPVTVIGDKAFVDCRELTSVVLPEGVVLIDDEAFFGCEGLASVTVPKSLMATGRHAFCRCPNLKSFDVHPENMSYVFEDGFLMTHDRTWLIRALSPQGEVTIPSGVEEVDVGAFAGCEAMTSVTIPEGVRCLGDDAFENCGNLTTVTIPRSLQAIAYDVFYGYRRLTTMRVCPGDAERVHELLEENASADVNCDFIFEEV